ncbi:MAG: hypothetical protein K2Q21_10655 [Chitinophagaceae bacterium]|nr:hypothetical protein [Chitinophagaceae bacterium]
MKELKKMNLNELKTLSRKEMKNIMAGSGGSGGSCNTNCFNRWNCSYLGNNWISSVCTSTSAGSGYGPGICTFMDVYCN